MVVKVVVPEAITCEQTIASGCQYACSNLTAFDTASAGLGSLIQEFQRGNEREEEEKKAESDTERTEMKERKEKTKKRRREIRRGCQYIPKR